VQIITLLNKTDLMHLSRLTSVWQRRIEEEESDGRSRVAAAAEEEACVRAR
jgi:hypothetical protein